MLTHYGNILHYPGVIFEFKLAYSSLGIMTDIT